jgi:hypothetical protein
MPGIPSTTAPDSKYPTRRVRLVVISLACVLGVLTLSAAIGLTGYTLGDRASRTQPAAGTTPAAVAASPSQRSEETAEQDGPVEQLRAFVDAHGSLEEQQVAAHVTRIHGLESLDGDFPRVKLFTDYAAPTGEDYEALTAYDAEVALLASSLATWRNQGGEAWLTVYAADGTMLGTESF